MSLTKLKYINNLTDEKLAQKIGISRSQLYRIKTGKSFPSAKFLVKLKQTFPNIDLDEIIEELEKTRKQNTEKN